MPDWPKTFEVCECCGAIESVEGDLHIGGPTHEIRLAPFNLTWELYGLLESIIGDPETPQRWRKRIEEGLDHYEQECRRDD